MNIKELARLANTSTAAVSLILNNKWQKMVRQDTAKRVLKLAQKHGYSPNIAGRSLVMQRNFRIAICAESKLINHPVMGAYSFHESLGIISAALSRSSYSIDIIHQDQYKNNVDDLNHRLKSTCEGIIFLNSSISSIKRLIEQLSLEIPYVVVDCDLKDNSLNYIYSDMESSVNKVISGLVKKGHHKIGVIRGENSNTRFNQKLRGYKEALSDHNIKYLPELVFSKLVYDPSKDVLQNGILGAEKLLSLKTPPTAILCTDNSCGIGFIHYANKNDINIPEDIELVGFGDEAISMFSSPRLTYLKRPIKEMAEKAVSIILEWIEEKNDYSPVQYRFENELVVQETAKINMF